MRLALPLVLPLLLGASAPGPERGRIEGKVVLAGADGDLAASGVAGVVVYVTGFSEPPPRGAPMPQIVQRGRHFEPPLVAITAGQEVAFPNLDPFFHNVFSLSPGQRFDLGQYRRGETKTRLFRDPGPIEVYCNIHPDMAATILVLPNARFAMTAADGSFVIEGVPAGTWPIYAYDRFASAPVKGSVTVAADATAQLSFTITRTRAAFPHKNKYGEAYRDPKTYGPAAP